jgi:hypothetical protein
MEHVSLVSFGKVVYIKRHERLYGPFASLEEVVVQIHTFANEVVRLDIWPEVQSQVGSLLEEAKELFQNLLKKHVETFELK